MTHWTPRGTFGLNRSPSRFEWLRRAQLAILCAVQLAALVLAFALFMAPLAAADDCSRDPNNLRDCLRTPTAASNMAGTATIVVVVLVNGVEIGRVLLQPPEDTGTEPGGEEGTEKDKEQRTFVLQVETRDDQGAIRSVLDTDILDQLTISAWAVEVGKGPLPEATESITFNLATPSPWVEMFETGGSAGRRSVGLRSVKMEMRGTPPAQVVVHVSATFEGQTVQASVSISLAHRQVQAEVLDPITNDPIPVIHQDAGVARLRFTLLDRSGSRTVAPRGGLVLRLAIDDRSLADPDETDEDLPFEEGQSVLEIEYDGFVGGEMRNGGGVVSARVSDEDGRPVALICPPGREPKTALRFVVIAPLSIENLSVAISRVAGEGATDHVEKKDNFVIDLTGIDDVVADTEV